MIIIIHLKLIGEDFRRFNRNKKIINCGNEIELRLLTNLSQFIKYFTLALSLYFSYIL